MNDRQLELIMQIIEEQLGDYLTKDLAEEIIAGIAEGINDNMPLIEDLGAIE